MTKTLAEELEAWEAAEAAKRAADYDRNLAKLRTKMEAERLKDEAAIPDEAEQDDDEETEN